MSNNDLLLDPFDHPNLDDWRHEVDRLLKGAPFAARMFTDTLEGIRVGPLYTAADTADLAWLQQDDGREQFLREGPPAGGVGWLVAQELPLATPSAFNTALLHDLERGQTAANLILEDAAVRGTPIGDLDALRTALAGVDLGSVPLLLQAGPVHARVAADLKTLLREQGVPAVRLAGRLGCDPWAGLGTAGRLPVPLDDLHDELAELTRWALAEAPQVRTLPVYEDPWHDGGADGGLGLGLTLAAAVASLRAMEERGVAPDLAAGRIHFNLCVGSDFFMEIARLRALRVLWSRILAACGCAAAAPPVIHVRTSRRTGTLLDPHVNMLRATTQAMAAVLGGADSLHVAPFDEAAGGPDPFSRRIARNVQLVLAHECHLDHVADPAGGSWYVEKLTGEIAARAWEHLQAVDQSGGMAAALAAGRIQDWVAAAAAARAARLGTRREVLVGTNQYPDPQPLAAVVVDQVAHEFAVPLRRDGAPFEMLRARIEELGKRDAAAGRVHCLCLGDVAAYRPRLEFTRRFFRVGGFAIAGGGFEDTVDGAVARARTVGAKTVVLVGLDQTYAAMGAAVVSGLLADPDPPVVMIAGQPRAELAMVETVNMQSDVLEVLDGLAGRIGGGA